MNKFGLGTFALTDGDMMVRAVKELGYRSFDCASFYGNEELVGKALDTIFNKDKVCTREEFYITSKAWPHEVTDVEAACRRSLKNLGVEYLDMYLVHWPIAMEPIDGPVDNMDTKWKRINIPMHKVWAQMESLVDKGLVKSIGISNFNVQMMWDMISYARIMPAVNEVELHPLLVQDKLVKFMKANNIVPIAYCPIARGSDSSDVPNVIESELVVKLSEKYKKTGAQILLNWGLCRGHVVIPRSSKFHRL